MLIQRPKGSGLSEGFDKKEMFPHSHNKKHVEKII